MKMTDTLKSFGWNVINPFLLKIKKNKKYKFPAGYHGLNIGCGLHNPPSWVGIDGGFSHYVVHRTPKVLLKPFLKSSVWRRTIRLMNITVIYIALN